jgi:queuosine precursor transporter
MGKEPSFKIAVIVISLYSLFLFVPTFDVAATYKMNLYFFHMPISVAGLIFPAVYPLADSVTEVYGKNISYYMVVMCYVAAVLFSFFNNALLSQSQNHVLYSFILRSSLLLTIAGPIGYFITALFNVKLLNKLKIKMRGKHFIVRSLICSGISEIIISFIVYPAIFYPKGLSYALMISLGTCLVKIILTVPMVFVARFLVVLYRYIDKIETLPYSENLAEFASKKLRS